MLSIRQRRQLGITFANVMSAVRELKESGEVDASTSHSEVAGLVMDRLSKKDPQAFGAPGLDLDAILKLIETLLPLILKLLGL